jgi:hypothetical protein
MWFYFFSFFSEKSNCISGLSSVSPSSFRSTWILRYSFSMLKMSIWIWGERNFSFIYFSDINSIKYMKKVQKKLKLFGSNFTRNRRKVFHAIFLLFVNGCGNWNWKAHLSDKMAVKIAFQWVCVFKSNIGAHE